MQHDEGTVEYESEKKRLEMASDILMVGNDIQMLTGKVQAAIRTGSVVPASVANPAWLVLQVWRSS